LKEAARACGGRGIVWDLNCKLMPNKDLRAEWKSSEKVSKPQYITDILIAIRKPRKVVREGTKADQYRRVASAARAASF